DSAQEAAILYTTERQTQIVAPPHSAPLESERVLVDSRVCVDREIATVWIRRISQLHCVSPPMNRLPESN
ncbi:MAG: hypothetical protein KC561_07965, partial [Myxococcales bacterium]|nr:hypothetical protein [Myxococcales bacterium]